jgi:hypothetical protein
VTKRTISITENEPAVMVCRSRPHNHGPTGGPPDCVGDRSHVGWCQSETTSITENEPAVMVCRSGPHNHRPSGGPPDCAIHLTSSASHLEPIQVNRHRDRTTAARIFIHLVVEVPSTCSVSLTLKIVKFFTKIRDQREQTISAER